MCNIVSRFNHKIIEEKGIFMMKKNGFTLAEVLITLAIIGVIATMTLPGLMTNVGEEQAKTGLKKVVNTLTEAGQMSKTISGFDYTEFNVSADIDSIDTDDTLSMEALLRARTAVDYVKTATGDKFPAESSVDGAVTATSLFNNGKAIHFRDGSILMYNPGDTLTGTNTMDDGMAQGYVVAIDTNGFKGPNILSKNSHLRLER